VAFEYGGSGGYRHYISTTHTGTTGSHNNSMSFWINNGAQALSTDPGTGNVQALTLTPLGVGIGTQTPYRKFDVVGDIVTSVHGTGTQHDPSELIGLRRIGHTTSSALEFVGMGLTVKDKESDGTTARANNAHIAFYTWGNSLWGAKEVIRISERGRLGINTTNPTSLLHVNGNAQIGSQGPTVAPFNTGVAGLTLTGANGNASGPHQSWNTDSDVYPQRHFLNWTHDNIWDCWDCYYGPDGTGAGGNNIRGSNTSSAFRWQKNATDLILTTDPSPTAGGILTLTNRFWINETGKATFSEDLTAQKTITAGPGGVDILGNGTLNRLGQESLRMQNTPVWTYGGFAGIGNNPMPLPAGSNGLRQANANFAGGNGCCVYTPAIRAAGSPFYVYVESTWGTAVGGDRTNHPGVNMSVPTGWVATYISNGTIWEYQGKVTTTEFNAGRTAIISTNNPGIGNNGNYLRSSGNGQLYWSATVVADEALSAEVASQKKTIDDLIKRIKKLEGKK